jgi:hypothetical protein
MDRTTTFMLDQRDHRRGARLHLARAMRDRRTRLRLALLWLVATIVIFAFGLPLVLAPLVIRQRFRREALLREPVVAHWDEAAYRAHQAGVESRVAWGTYVAWDESPDLFVLFLSDYNFQLLPKRALDAAQIDDLRTLLATR